MSQGNSPNLGNRSFTLEKAVRSGKNLNISGGRYMSTIPANAAKKAFSHVLRQKDFKGRVTMEIHIRETTQNSAHKIYKYKVSKKNQETKVEKNGETILYKYITQTKSI
jgi:hypothetical protein